MNIGFYGHSAASWYGNSISFIDRVKTQLDCNIVNIGVAQGCEERILFDLKKTKKLDIAVIFHQRGPKYMFLPKCNRDLSMDSVPENKAKILWSESGDIDDNNIEHFESEFFSYGKIKEVFQTPENFIQSMKTYKEYFYHPDLQRNRFESATYMVDAYCLARVPKVIHISDYDYKLVMPWFSFKSGIIADDIQQLVNDNYIGGNPSLPNNITIEGNKLVADKIIETIYKNNWHV